jgi:hypothetical protein
MRHCYLESREALEVIIVAKTPRNGFDVNVAQSDMDMLCEIDAVYEICDAEFNSDAAIHNKMRAIYERQAPNPVDKGLVVLKPMVAAVAAREGLMQGADDATLTVISRQLSSDWNRTLGADVRREQSASPSP